MIALAFLTLLALEAPPAPGPITDWSAHYARVNHLASVIKQRSERLHAPTPQSVAQEIGAAVHYSSRMWNIPPAMLIAVIEVESTYKPYAVSNRRARGLMQLRRGTAEEVLRLYPAGPSIVHGRHILLVKRKAGSIFSNVYVGAAYLHHLKKRFRTWPRALTAYNRGPGAFVRGGRITNAYAHEVLRRFRRIRRAIGLSQP